MTESYILYLQTDLSLEDVLEFIFTPKSIAPIEGTDLVYARGTVYLAHAQALNQQMQEKQDIKLGFRPTISIRYFPDGVSSVKTAMDILAEGIVRWLKRFNDNLLLSANNKVDVIKSVDSHLSLNTSHNFLEQGRIKLFDMPYSEE